MELFLWEKHFKNNPKVSPLLIVKQYQYFSFYDIFPYLSSEGSKEIINVHFSETQKKIPSLSLNDTNMFIHFIAKKIGQKKNIFLKEQSSLSFFSDLNTNFIDTLNFNIDQKTINPYIQELADELFGPFHEIHIRLIFEEKNTGKFTKTEYEVMNFFLEHSNLKLTELKKDITFTDDLNNACFLYILETTKKITSELNIEFKYE